MANKTGLELETSFTESSFKTSFNYENAFATAKRLQTLILMEPGTIPNLVECGLGIKRYLFNFRDDATLNEINSRIQDQVKRFMPNGNIKSISAEVFQDKNGGKKSIVITGYVFDSSDAELAKQIAISFSRPDLFSDSIVSEIYL